MRRRVRRRRVRRRTGRWGGVRKKEREEEEKVGGLFKFICVYLYLIAKPRKWRLI